MASFLKKTTFNKPEATTAQGPKLGGGVLGKASVAPLKTKSLGKAPASSIGTKPLGGSLLKKKNEPQEIELNEEVSEEVIEKEVVEEVQPTSKPKLGAKKSLVKKSIEEIKEKVEVEMSEPSEKEIQFEEVTKVEPAIVINEDDSVTINAETVEIKEEQPKEEKKTTKKKTSKRNNKAKQEEKSEQQVLNTVEVDETKRVSLEEMDSIMRPIVAPTTALWEQEKKDVLEALNAIKVEQDMNMAQVKSCLSELDELKFEILPKQHDAETMYDGTKQNYDTVKAIAIANGSGSNAEARKAEGILACQNFVTPSGEVVDLHQYMLLIEERYKFYEKIAEGVNFKKYSLVNYNNAIKAEKEGK